MKKPKLNAEQLEKRKKHFTRLTKDHPHIINFVSRLPSSVQGEMHDLLKFCFQSGYSIGITEERKENRPIEVGGCC